MSIGTSQAMDVMYVYLRQPKVGAAPNGIVLDGRPLTDSATFAADPSAETTPVVVCLKEPLRTGDFHMLQVTCGDGATATTGFRVRNSNFIYGMWGYPHKKDGMEKDVSAYLEDLRLHNIT